MPTKLCCKCKVEKPYEDFSADHNGKYGLSSKCKICCSKTFKEYYEKNKKLHNGICRETVICTDCLVEYKRGGKTEHYKTKKHKELAAEYKKMISIEQRIEKKNEENNNNQ